MDDDSWVEMVRPIVERFDLAAAVGMDATHNPDGARAISRIMTAMAAKLDWARPEIARLRAEVAELREVRKAAGGALRCALSPDADRIAREGFTEVALAYLAGYGGDWNAMQAAEKGRTRGH